MFTHLDTFPYAVGDFYWILLNALVHELIWLQLYSQNITSLHIFTIWRLQSHPHILEIKPHSSIEKKTGVERPKESLGSWKPNCKIAQYPLLQYAKQGHICCSNYVLYFVLFLTFLHSGFTGRNPVKQYGNCSISAIFSACQMKPSSPCGLFWGLFWHTHQSQLGRHRGTWVREREGESPVALAEFLAWASTSGNS